MPQELIEKYKIDIIPLSVILGPEIITETEITNETFYAKLNQSAFHPTSTQPTIESIYTVFEKYVLKGDSVIFTCISSDMSGTYSTALTVKNQLVEEYPNAQIEIVDSRSNCMEHGYSTLAGAKAIAQGKDIAQVIDAIKATVPKSRILFIPESLKYLQESGRLSKVGALAGSVLKIVPILTVKDGKADVFTKIRTRKKAKIVMLDELKQDVETGEVTDLSVLHINSENEAKKYIGTIKEFYDKDINVSSIGPVVGAHVGPGTLGIVWVKA